MIKTFMDFPNGVIDCAGGYNLNHITPTLGAPGGGYFGRFVGDENTLALGDPDNIRIHCNNFPGATDDSYLVPGAERWRAVSLRVPSGYDHQNVSCAYDEFHQTSHYGTTGPAPLNLNHDSVNGQWWRPIVRGGNNRGLAGDPFEESAWSARDTEPDMPGGNVPVTVDVWFHWRMGFLLDYLGNGWFECWARWGTMTDWLNVIPRVNNIYTCFNNENYPQASLYRKNNITGTLAVDYAHGAWADTFTEISTWQDQKLGFTTPTGDTTAPSFVSAVVNSSNPSAIVVTYDEALDETVDGSWTAKVNNIDRTVTGANASGQTDTLSLSSSVVAGDVVKISTGATRVRDAAGNIAAALVDQAVDNNLVAVLTLPSLDADRRRFGRTTVGSSRSGFTTDSKRMSLISITEDASVDVVWVYTQQNPSGVVEGSTQSYRVIVYDTDGGSGEPGTLRAISNAITKVAPFDPEWDRIVLPLGTLSNGDSYWVGTISSVQSNIVFYGYNTVTSALRWGADTYSDGASDPCGAMGTDNKQMTMCLEGSIIVPEQTKITGVRVLGNRVIGTRI